MGKGEVQIMNWRFRGFILLLSMCGSIQAGEIRLSLIERRMLPVAVESLADEVKTDKEFTGLTIWKNGKIEQIDVIHRDIILDDVFKSAVESDSKKEAFFGESRYFLAQEGKSEKAYLLIVEKTGKRFRIAPLEVFAGGCWIQQRSAQISKNPQLLDLISSLLEPGK